jgi:hypothetical protein
MRHLSNKRLLRKLGKLSNKKFEEIKRRVASLYLRDNRNPEQGSGFLGRLDGEDE